MRRRTPSGVARFATQLGVVAALLVALLTGCDGERQAPDPATSSAPVDGSTAARDGTSSPTGSSTAGGSSGAAGVVGLGDAAPLVAAAAVVPQRAAVVTFTDLDRLKSRLGYTDLTSESAPSRRFAFWERVRADGAAFTGTRLYDPSSVMALDYGWTGEDVSWEVDFALPETGCYRSMLCETAHGYVLGLRRDLDWSVVTDSLRRNGFEPDGSDPGTFRTDDPRAPFSIVHLIPELHAVVGGNAIGVLRASETAAGAPPFGVRIAAVYDRVADAESLRVATGCVDLDDALGPDATSDDVVAFLRSTPINALAPAVSTVVAVTDRRHATIVVETGDDAPQGDLALRTATIRRWPGLQAKAPFEAVARVTGRLDSAYETFALDVTAMPQLRAMALTDDAPWALCPGAEAR